MKRKGSQSILNTDQRIRLGIWGLGRGLYFYRMCAALNMDVVAGCDFNKHMRDKFLQENPGARVTDNDEEFLSWDFDAVLMATYCQEHGRDAVRCLRAGKHVLSEVTSFHTMAEGVRLVEEVEKCGKVYNLAENYPFSRENMYLARKWKEGLFGELQYAEYEYAHETLFLCYTYIDSVPVRPGDTVHNWRSWLSDHYYNTHSLGPVMIITGERPTSVVSLPGVQTLAGYPMKAPEAIGGITPCLMNMSNGSVMRNLMGATTNDGHIQRLWGTLGSSEIIHNRLWLRLGGGGDSPLFEVNPDWDGLGEMASQMGHGGGDFWVLYYFARQILTGESAPFDIFTACDCTIPGILAYRSSLENGKVYEVPDFRKKRERDRYRHDETASVRYNLEKGCFPRNADREKTQHFTRLMRDLIFHARTLRAFTDWNSVAEDVKEPERVIQLADKVIRDYPEMTEVMKSARKLADAYPRSDGGRVLREMLEQAGEEAVLKPDFLKWVKQERLRLKRLVKNAYDKIPVA